MSTGIQIDNDTLIPIKESLRSVSYSKDYIARLAREGKIVASQVGRQWYIDLSSLQNFAKSSALIEQVRQEKLSRERKKEIESKELIKALDIHLVEKNKLHRKEALTVTVATLLVGLLTGVGAYSASLLPNTFLAGVVDSFVPSQVVQGDNPNIPVIQEVKDILVHMEVIEKANFVTTSEVEHLSTADHGIFVFPASGEVKSREELKELFSDEVTVTFNDSNSGFITYETQSGESREYPFLTVPVKNNNKNITDSYQKKEGEVVTPHNL